MVSGPEMSRIIKEFELSQELVSNTARQIKGVQNIFRNQVNAFCSTIEEMGNPFADQTGDLIASDTRDIAIPRLLKRSKL